MAFCKTQSQGPELLVKPKGVARPPVVATKRLSKTGPSQADLLLPRGCLLSSMSSIEIRLQQSGVAHCPGMGHRPGAPILCWDLSYVCRQNLQMRQPLYCCRFMMLKEMADRQRVRNQQEVKFGGESGPEVPIKKKRKKLRRRRPFLSRPGLTDEQRVEWLQSHSKVSDGQH